MRTLNKADRIAIERELASRSLSDFVSMAWHVLDPGIPYVHGWHMDAMAEHLEALARGEIKRLLINVPPGTSKSTMTGVMFPAWLWGPGKRPHFRFIGASHEETLAIRDNLKCRRLVMSEWFQERWPIDLTTDQSEKKYFENVKTGFRQATAVASMTGRRGDIVLWDDPLSPEKAHSDIHRETALRIFRETLPTRLNSPTQSGIVIVMQRLHENDVSGYILEKDLGYEKLILPMEFESDRKCHTGIGWKDPRTEEGELLFPERFPRETVERDKAVMGPIATAGQFQQRPMPRGGGMFQREWFEIVDAAPAKMKRMRGWDLAATADTSAAWTAGCKMGVCPQGVVYIEDVRRIQGDAGQVERLLLRTAAEDGKRVKGSLPQDPGQAGKAQVAYLIKKLIGYSYRATPESGSKEVRAEPLAAQAAAGNVKIVRGHWNDAFLDEITSFPMGKYKDQVDAATRAFSELVMRKGGAGTMKVHF